MVDLMFVSDKLENSVYSLTRIYMHTPSCCVGHI